MVGLVGAGLEVEDGMHAERRQGGWSHVGRCRSISRVRGDALISIFFQFQKTLFQPFACHTG